MLPLEVLFYRKLYNIHTSNNHNITRRISMHIKSYNYSLKYVYLLSTIYDDDAFVATNRRRNHLATSPQLGIL